MRLNLEDKQAIVAEVADVASRAVSAVVADYRGLTVSQMTSLRANARKSGVYMRVIRNTLAKRAMTDTTFSCMDDALAGPSLLAFSIEDPGAAARVIHDFVKSNDKLVVKALALGGKLYAANDLASIASLPTKDEAISQLMSVMIAPVTKFVRTTQETYAQLARVVAAIRDQKEAQA